MYALHLMLHSNIPMEAEMTNFSRRQVLSLPMAASVVGAGAAGAAYAADSNSKVNAPDFDAIEDRMTLLTKRGASLSIRQKHLAVLSVAAGLGFEDLGERTAAAALADGLAPGGLSCFSLCRHGANSSSVGRRSYCHDGGGYCAAA